jgi:hypothetical protein
MKFLIEILVVAILALVIQTFLPWYSAAFAGLVAGLTFNSKALISFSAAFAGVFLVWLGYAFWLDTQNASVLSSKIAVLFSVNKPVLLLLITGIIGGITGGLGGWAGSELRKLFA